MKKEQPAVIKYQLGWKFTEEDERRADRAIKHANQYVEEHFTVTHPDIVNFSRYIHTNPTRKGND